MKHLFTILLLACFTDCSAQFNCKDTTLKFYFYSMQHNYPKAAVEASIQGEVIISFDIDSTCSLTNRNILQGLGYGCDEEALKALDKIEKSIKKGKHSKCYQCTQVMIPVIFKL